MGETETWLVAFASHLQGRVHPRTAALYRQDVARYLSAGVDPCLATSAQLVAYARTLAESGLQPATLHRKRSALRAFYDFLIETGAVAADPTAALLSLAISPPAIPLPSVAEVQQLLHLPVDDAGSLRDRLVATLIYAGVLSVGVLVDLQCADVSQAAVGRLRSGVLPGPAWRLLCTYLERGRPALSSRPTAALLLDNRGRRLSNTAVYALLALDGQRAIGRTVTPGQLRAAAASHLLAVGCDPHLLPIAVRPDGPGERRLRQIYDSSHPRAHLSSGPPSYN